MTFRWVDAAWRAALACAALLPVGAAAKWHEASTKHFVVYADESADQVRSYATRLERFDQSIRAFMKVADDPVAPANRIRIYLLPNAAAVSELAADKSGALAGFYIARAGDTVAFAARPSGQDWLREGLDHSTLFHEYAHHFMLTTWSEGAFPAWLVEGLAELLSTATIDDRQVMIGGAPNSAGRDMNQAAPIPSARLLTADASAAQNLPGFYGRSWLMTHYLLLGGGGRETLGRYIAAINRGEPAAKAAEAFGDLTALDRKLTSYVSRGRLPGVPVAVDSLPPIVVTVRPLGDGEAAVMPARLRSKGVHTPKATAEIAALARRLAAPYPTDPDAQVALAEAELDAGNAVEADAAADRALAADPKRVVALVQKGTAQMLLAARDPASDPARWKAVRQWFARAIALDAEDPAPLIAYNRSFWEARQEQSAEAKDALLLAQSLAPQDVGLRLRTGRMLVVAGEVTEALPMLRVVASDPHAGIRRDTARLLVEQLERGDLAAAKATIQVTAPKRVGPGT